MSKYEIKYEKFRSSIWLDGELIKGFSCYHTEHAHKLGREYLIKLKNLLALNKMTYNSGPDGEHNKRMMMQLELFKEEYSLPNQLPPENSSATTLDEVRYFRKTLCFPVD